MILTTSLIFGQTKKEVENGLFVTFPIYPEYKTNTQGTSYVGKTKNCFFMTLVLRVIPNYHQYVIAKKKWTQSEIKEVEDSFLDNAVKGKVDYTGNKYTRSSEIKISEYRGRKVEYSAVNPANGVRGKRFFVMLLVRDKLVNFECWYLIDNETSKSEKDKFLNSISVN